ncbi:MAG: hypothetical protein E5299_02558 [Burkholderia gladioli]|nr:MAG: hypothetical protein E5299_02558 [Burkholderia gladioli]
MASTGILITNFGSIISGDMNGLRTSEVRNPFRCVLTLDLCNNAAPVSTSSAYAIRFAYTGGLKSERPVHITRDGDCLLSR